MGHVPKLTLACADRELNGWTTVRGTRGWTNATAPANADDLQDAGVDVMADVLHWIAAQGWSIQDVADRAVRHVRDERHMPQTPAEHWTPSEEGAP
jgi:hypothetical protein